MNLHSYSTAFAIVGLSLLVSNALLSAQGSPNPSSTSASAQLNALASNLDPDIDASVRAEQAKFDELYSDSASVNIARSENSLDGVLERYLAKAPSGEWARHQHFNRVYVVCRVLAERGDPQRAKLLGERLARRLAQERQRGGASDEVSEHWTALEADVWLDVLHDVDGALTVLDAPGAAWSDRQGLVAQRRERVAARDRAQIAQTLTGELMRERLAAEQRATASGSE